MAELFGKRFTRRELESYFGNRDQVAGITFGELSDGRARGVRVAEVRTGSGFSFTVVLDRCMDVSRADFCGRSLCWRSITGDTHPAYYEADGISWLRGFGGGLVTTCGLGYFGAPCVDGGASLGIHGRISNTPAERLGTQQYWAGNDWIMSLTGEMMEGHLFGACLRLRRTIRTKLGAKSFTIHDEVTNAGPRPAPLMLLYHCNLGFPALGPQARVLAPSLRVQPNTPTAEKGKARYAQCEPPQRGFAEMVYEHDLAAKAGKTCAALLNPAIDDGFGVVLRWRKEQLPVLTQWKMMGEAEYVMGLEPGTNGVTGRVNEREKARLTTLRPGEAREFDLEVGVVSGAADVRAVEREVRAVAGGRKAKIGTCGG